MRKELMLMFKEVPRGRAELQDKRVSLAQCQCLRPTSPALTKEAHGAWGNRNVLQRSLGPFSSFGVRGNDLLFNSGLNPALCSVPMFLKINQLILLLSLLFLTESFP